MLQKDILRCKNNLAESDELEKLFKFKLIKISGRWVWTNYREVQHSPVVVKKIVWHGLLIRNLLKITQRLCSLILNLQSSIYFYDHNKHSLYTGVYRVERTLKYFPSPTVIFFDFLPHILHVKFDILKTKGKGMQIICRDVKFLEI